MSSPLLVGHLVSGGGTTMEHVARQMINGELGDIRPSVVIADRVCGALERAKALKIPTELIQKSDFDGNLDKWSDKIIDVLQRYQVDIVFQNGLISRTPKNVIDGWADSFYNQHPAPLSGNKKPDFGGEGMCGSAAVAARILYLLESCEEDPDKLTTESTVHMVTPELDDGHLVRVQPYNIARIIELCRDYGISTIAAVNEQREPFDKLVGMAQKELLAIEHFNVGHVLFDRTEGRRTRVDKDDRATNIDDDILSRVKAAAKKMYPTK